MYQSDVAIRCSKGKALLSSSLLLPEQPWETSLKAAALLSSHYLPLQQVLPLGEGGRPEVCHTPSFS